MIQLDNYYVIAVIFRIFPNKFIYYIKFSRIMAAGLPRNMPSKHLNLSFNNERAFAGELLMSNFYCATTSTQTDAWHCHS